MIKVSVFYPNEEGKKFDMAYYCSKHIPLCQEKFGCRQVVVDQGLAGGAPGTSPTYVAMGHLYFDSLEALQTAFAAHAAEIMADIPNYTDISPVMQISEIKM
jgi:uncharacterized protein (TIGR02118 family)